MPAAADRLVGSAEPRISVVPTGDARRGVEVVEFAREVLGIELMPWQRVVLDRACRTTADDRWRYRTVFTLVSRQAGKSAMTGVRILAGLLLWGERLVIAASQSRDISLAAFRSTLELAEEADLPIRKVMRASGREELIFEGPDGLDARYKVVTASAGGARGLSADLVVLDEVREFKSWDVWSAMEKTRRARPTSQLWAISTEGTQESLVLDELQRQGREAAASGATDGTMMYLEWSAPPGLAPDDPAAWVAANPALGLTVSEETIRAELATDPPETFEMEVLGRRVAVSRSWLRPGGWEACTDATATVPDDAAGSVVFGIDARPDLQHASIVAAWLRDDRRVHVEAVATFAGPDASAQAESRLGDLVERWQPRALAVMAKGPAEPVAGRVAAATGTPLTTVGIADMGRATRSFYDAVASRRLVHPPDQLLAGHIAAAEQDEPGLFALRKRNPVVDIDAAVAGVLALWVVDRAPVAPKLTWVAV